MCFTFKVSLGTFLFSWSISIYLLQKKLTKQWKQYIYSLLIFSSMQLLDAILWYIKMEKNIINYIVTSILIPFILSLLLYYNLFEINKNINIYFVLIFIVSSIYLFYRFNGYSISLCSNKLSSPIWGSNEIKLWEILGYCFLLFFNNYSNIAFILSIIFILFIYLFLDGAYGSLWCAIANLSSLWYLYKLI